MRQTRRHRRSLCLFSACVLFCFMEVKLCLGSDKLPKGYSLSGGDTIISEDGTFEMGFFSKTDTSDHNLFLGIWYKNFAEKTIVWVANREKPLRNTPGSRLQISGDGDGNLVMLEESDIVWSTNMSSVFPASVEAVLLDVGNLIIRDVAKPSVIYWQSFDHPTDTWLPEGKLGFNKINGNMQRLTSWKNADDASPGMFSVGISPNETNKYFLEWNMSVRYWSSGSWNGTTIFNSVPELSHGKKFVFVSNENESYYTYTNVDPDALSLLRITPSGKFEQLTSFKSERNFSVVFVQPRKESDIFALCGAFGIFINSSSTCSCMQGFSPIAAEATGQNDWFGGCERKTPIQCENSTSGKGKKQEYLKISTIKLPANSNTYPAQNDGQCKLACTQNCTCTAYAFSDRGCFVWEGALYDIRQLSNNDSSKQDLHVKASDSDLPDTPGKGSIHSGKGKTLLVVVAVLVPLVVLVSVCFIGCFCKRKMKQKGTRNKSSKQDLLSFDFNVIGNRTNDETNLQIGRKKDFNLPMFSYASVSKATDNFSAETKLGEGGFGPVYKGKLLNGQEIAVKRLSQRSAQGFVEFRNEIELIAKLQHRNLVRLLGCCVDQDESILIYEYLPNRSLDFLLFDSKNDIILDWATRVQIIEGIAQGLVYLHEYSRMRVVHRDLKASNILLDSEMNPKISDFGMARIFGSNNSRINTQRIVGTYGYMAPEYAIEGSFSVKSDVFSFGVLVLEILSGKKNTGFYEEDCLSLLGHTWELWTSNRGVELMDPVLGSPKPSLLRYINLGLLCVQDNPRHRPTMSTVISMLNNEVAPLPEPKQPAFTTNRSITNTASPSNGTAGNYSLNSLSLSMVEPK